MVGLKMESDITRGQLVSENGAAVWVVGQFESGTVVPPVNHAQDARATIKVTHQPQLAALK
jgi:hypothetical protein